MADHEEIDNLYLEMESFLKAVGRKLPSPSQPIILKTEFKNSLRVTDSNKQSFPVDESVLSPFRDTYIDKNYKTIRLHDWEFEIEFEGKICKRISLIAGTVIFVGAKNVKKEITGCHFKIQIIEREEDLKKLSLELNGHLKRIGKRHICAYSRNIVQEVSSLGSFIPHKPVEKTDFSFKPWVKADPTVLDPLSTLNGEGKKVLQKLRHFINREQIYDFIVEQEVSEQAVVKLKKIALGGK